MTDRPHDGSILSTSTPGWTRRPVLALIAGYQRWLSPYKGFRCAHAVLHGGTSCSQAVADIVAVHGLYHGRALIRTRMHACRAAAAELAARKAARSRATPGAVGREGEGRCARRCRDCADCGGCLDIAGDTCSCVGRLPLRHCDDCACDCF